MRDQTLRTFLESARPTMSRRTEAGEAEVRDEVRAGDADEGAAEVVVGEVGDGGFPRFGFAARALKDVAAGDASNRDHDLILWEVGDGNRGLTFVGHTLCPITSLTFGRLLADDDLGDCLQSGLEPTVHDQQQPTFTTRS